MANIDDIKIKDKTLAGEFSAPISSFRPGQKKRIQLPTSIEQTISNELAREQEIPSLQASESLEEHPSTSLPSKQKMPSKGNRPYNLENTNLEQSGSKFNDETSNKLRTEPQTKYSSNLEQNLEQRGSKFSGVSKKETSLVNEDLQGSSDETNSNDTLKLRTNLEQAVSFVKTLTYTDEELANQLKPDDNSSSLGAYKSTKTELELSQRSSKFNAETSNKLRTKPRTREDLNLEQNLDLADSRFNAETSNKLRTNDIRANKLRSNLEQNLDQTSNRTSNKLRTVPAVATMPSALIASTSGLKQTILFYLYLRCKLNAEKTTGPIKIGEISTYSETTVLSAQEIVRRLVRANLLQRESVKEGRGGWTDYRIPNEVFAELQRLDFSGLIQNLEQTSNKLRTELRTELRSNTSSSISSNYNTTNTREPVTNVPSYVEQVLPNEWKPFSESNFEGIDIDPISNIGFTETHLKQIYTRKLCSREILQESIYRFAFDLSENNKRATIKSSALGLFMGVMNRQGEYAKPDNYKSPREIAAERRAKEIQAENERISKLKAETFEAEFNVWWNSLSHEEQKQISPPSTLGERHRTTKARMYYRSEILGESKETQ
ncbi:MAG: hypothetical protein R3A80_14200 [Bdellovibrionota bacterium]